MFKQQTKHNLVYIIMLPILILTLILSTLQTTLAIDLPTNTMSGFIDSLDNSLLDKDFYAEYGYDLTILNVDKSYEAVTDGLIHYFDTYITLRNDSSSSPYLNILLNNLTFFNNNHLVYKNNTGYTFNKYTHSSYSLNARLDIYKDLNSNLISRYGMVGEYSTGLVADSSNFYLTNNAFTEFTNDFVAPNETFVLRFGVIVQLIGAPAVDLDVNSFDFKFVKMSQSDLLTNYYNYLDVNDIYDSGFSAGFDTGYLQGYDKGLIDGTAVSDYDSAFNLGYQTGYNKAVNEIGSYDLGYEVGLQNGLSQGLSDGYDTGYDAGYSQGLSVGFNQGSSENLSYGWLVGIFDVMGNLLNINILPNISIGMIVGIPIILGLVFFIIRLTKGGD